jgi:calcium channel MID1
MGIIWSFLWRFFPNLVDAGVNLKITSLVYRIAVRNTKTLTTRTTSPERIPIAAPRSCPRTPSPCQPHVLPIDDHHFKAVSPLRSRRDLGFTTRCAYESAMPLPKLSPLQSRVAASLGASVCLLLLYLAFASPHFAYATDVNSIRPEDHNHELLRGGRPFLDFELESDLELRGLSYEPEFLGVDRGIIGRAPTSNEPIPLINNVRQADNVPMGSTVSYIFTNASVWGSKSTAPLSPAMVRRQLLVNGDSVQETSDEDLESPVVGDLRTRQNAAISNRTVYITVTTCDQPQPIEPDGGYSPAPQLQVYVSVSEDNKSPGPNKSPQNMTELDRGFGSIEVNATSNVYIGIYGKNATAYQGVWNAEIAVSIDAPYHYYHDNENMLFVDSDSTSAYLTADDPSIYNGAVSDDESLSRASKPYVLFASSSVKNVSAIYGLQNSACGLATKAQFMPEGTRPGQVVSNVRTWLSMKRDVVVPEQMFAINGLQSGTTYDAVLAIPRDPNNIGTVGGGGQVFRRLSFTTLSGMDHHLSYNFWH